MNDRLKDTYTTISAKTKSLVAGAASSIKNAKYFSILDRYIIKKYLSTFFVSIVLIISVSVVFDYAEKVDDFSENNAPMRAIILYRFLPTCSLLYLLSYR